MSEIDFRKIQYYLISIVVVFEIALLSWEFSNGGVLSHHLLHRSDLPSISNWWGIIILPLLTWFSTSRIKQRIPFQSEDTSIASKIPKGILLGFFGMLIVSASQSIAFNIGFDNITMYLALSVLVTGLFFPIYRAECILGHVLGAVLIFGPVIPIMGMMVIGAISAVSNLGIKPLIVSIMGRKTSAE